ncbi:8-oxo-dGTP diphosphatase [Filimonas lacunae]|uniref:8-oxo-dGTP diphosphatase n=1 Tax=Filimonas lacunae TaxID=477680 RepID=A0A173MMN2_9BACT|nr:NUDIX domain-containing protein [Filimonas lacunae]BAV08661.1 Nudix-like regulator [Filimonas lacunae]SIS59493.1 8-oxo-dGTP diphosphatase [Filimonas lacunae]
MKAFQSYKNPSLAVDLVVFGYHENELSVLLLNRNAEPFANTWVLPGAFVQMDETFLQTCSRVLQTKLGMDNVYLEQLYSFDNPDRDPRGRAISVAYYALVNPHKFTVTAGQMANDVVWFPVKKIPALGFDHKEIFKMALQRLQSKILYMPIGFELLDELFTMTELHELYECILDITIDRRNFRRKILDSEYIINTGTKRDGLQNRHPDLYRFNKKLKKNQFQLSVGI